MPEQCVPPQSPESPDHEREWGRALVLEQAALIEQLRERIHELEEHIQTLEARLAQDSHNFSKPPSSDPPFKKPPPRSQRQPSGRSPVANPIDRATRWVYVEILEDKSARSASGFLKRLIDKAPFNITKVLTDNSKEFTDRFCATGQRQPTGAHAFDRVCTNNHTEHRLTKPRTPQTNGMIERFNGRIADVLATTRFDSAEHLADTLKRYVQVYNQHIPQQALGHLSPLQAMKNWYQKQPKLFNKRVYNLAGLDNHNGRSNSTQTNHHLFFVTDSGKR